MNSIGTPHVRDDQARNADNIQSSSLPRSGSLDGRNPAIENHGHYWLGRYAWLFAGGGLPIGAAFITLAANRSLVDYGRNFALFWIGVFIGIGPCALYMISPIGPIPEGRNACWAVYDHSDTEAVGKHEWSELF